jgi:hypothetical protein
MSVFTVYTSNDLDKTFDVLKSSFKDSKVGYVLSFEKETQQHTVWQLRTFYGLLNAFVKSGMSSFKTEEEAKEYYKRKIGLIHIANVGGLSEDGKFILREALDILPMSTKDQDALEKMMGGNVETIGSLSDATKDQMTEAIQLLIDDVMSAGADSDSKINKILEGMLWNNNAFILRIPRRSASGLFIG